MGKREALLSGLRLRARDLEAAVGAVAGAGGREGMAAAGALGREAGAALGAVLPVGGGLGLAGPALLDEAVQGVEVGAEALLEGLLRRLLGLAWLGHVTCRAGPGGSGWRAMPDPIVDGGRRVRQLFDCLLFGEIFFFASLKRDVGVD